ncbi:purine-nucleoside phosphorylase [Fusobacterium sp. MFO224]|uniref:purine-nucleoside phosphorylase n=1 Tax=Fusobacterium sp. MFO224 TaxID=3378070 RepID=UPI003853C724
MYDKVLESIKFIKSKTSYNPKIAIVLGSGLGSLTNEIEDAIEIDYNEIPNFPISTVTGHAGKLIFGKIGGTEVMAMKGRIHFYEGYSMKEVTYPIYIMKMFGIEKLILSNAAGGINPSFGDGTLMIIKDHINFFGTNPLIGKNDERFGTRFPDMTEVYSENFINLAKKEAKDLNIEYSEGVYLGTTGPSYETASEIRAYSTLGGDAVGMSTVPEAIVANYLGMEILGISCITNMATGLATKPHSHESVIEIAQKVEKDFCLWIKTIVKNLK